MTEFDPGWRERAAAPSGEPGTPASVDPLRLCVLTTVALLGGLLRSKCLLRDTRLVLGWLATLVLVAAVAIGRDVAHLF